tara:strand:+ start:1338 stop:1616 length:279 start_codon:yes stop_codon:yes gene_type:complete
MKENTPKIMGRRTRKKINPAVKSQISSPRGFSGDELRAVSIKAPKIRTAETSKIPVKIAINPDKVKRGKHPVNDQIRKEPTELGGEPVAGTL